MQEPPPRNAVVTFGCNDDGQLGRSDRSSKTPFTDEDVMTEANLPKMIQGLENAVAISCGSRHSMALTQDGNVCSWGWGKMGQLGHGNYVNALSTPTCIEYFTKNNICIKYISCGGCHSGAIAQDGTVYMWGESHWGQLGIPSYLIDMHQATPVPCQVLDLDSDEKIIQLCCGGTHTLALSDQGSVYAWGRADSGQLGIGKTWLESADPSSIALETPQKIEAAFDGEKVVQVACGAFHSAAVTASGNVYMWGKEDYGMLGVGPTADVHSPKRLEFFQTRPALRVSCGGWHTIVVTRLGETFAFGRNEYGRLGLGDTRSRSRPKQVEALKDIDIIQAASGGSHTLFLSKQGMVYSSGRKGHARLGSAKNSTSLVPELVQEFAIYNRKAVQVSAGGAHSGCLC